MRIASVVSYGLSLLFIYLSMLIAEGSHLNLWYFWDLSAFIMILVGLVMTLVNFKFSEIFNAVSDSLSKNIKVGFAERYNVNKLIISSVGTYTLYAAIVTFILAFIIVMSNITELSKLGPSIGLASIVLLYAAIIKLFMVTPLNTSLDRKMTELTK